MKEKREVKKDLGYYIAWSFVVFLPIFFGVMQVWAVVRVISLYGWHREPAFWAGAIVWGTVGLFLHKLRTWLMKRKMLYLIFIFSILALVHLARTKQFPSVFQFMMWGGLTLFLVCARVLAEAVRARKDSQIEAGETT
jgi:hypothetical protein